MIREKFIQTVAALEKAVKFSPQDVEILINLCKKVSISHSQTELLKIFRLCARIVHSIPDNEYYLHKEIVENLASALVELGKKHKRVSHFFNGVALEFKHFSFKKFIQFADPNIFAMALYLNLAVRLEDIGLPGEAYNSFIKSTDPWVKPYIRDTGVGNLQTEYQPLFDYLLLTQLSQLKFGR